jgi:hypothetical protein
MTQLLALPGEICVAIDVGPDELCIALPGGASVCATVGFEKGDPATILRAFLGSINTALAPLTPVFNIIDVVFAVKECIDAVPKLLTEGPGPLLECIPGLAEKLQKLVGLLPAASVPLLIRSIIQALIVFLQGLKIDIVSMAASLERILNASLRGTELGNVRLQAVADCAQNNWDVQLANLNASAAPMNRLMGLLNVFLELVGLPCIRIPLGTLPAEAEEALAIIDTAIEILQAALLTITVPDLQLPGVPAAGAPCD